MAQRYELWLKIFLQLSGLTLALAAVALFMPASWMAWAHQRMGMGQFPAAPIAEYLARLTSALYALLGVLVLLLARDIRRYSQLIACMAIGIPAVSFSVALMCLHQGMPLSWLVSDAISCVLFCVVTLVLLRQIRKHHAADDPR
jgi:hypothetical protein